MTAQLHEKLIYEGVEMSMTSCPPIPENPRIRTLSLEEMDAEEFDLPVLSTACWRHYVGTWEIRDSRLYLLKLEGCFKIEGEKPIFADWFSGLLRVPQGQVLQYVHMGFETIHEKELLLKVEKGVVTGKQEVDNRQQ
ncbi:MAG: hypothetical protein JXA25_04515 [Anaerolineales bacterium]|nr:hypothetical protein [Anaerolineales bacterium]